MRYYSTPEAARRLGVHRWKLTRFVRYGLVSPKCLGRHPIRGISGYCWSDHDLHIVRAVRYLLSVGFRVDQVRIAARDGQVVQIAEMVRMAQERAGEPVRLRKGA